MYLSDPSASLYETIAYYEEYVKETRRQETSIFLTLHHWKILKSGIRARSIDSLRTPIPDFFVIN